MMERERERESKGGCWRMTKRGGRRAIIEQHLLRGTVSSDSDIMMEGGMEGVVVPPSLYERVVHAEEGHVAPQGPTDRRARA